MLIAGLPAGKGLGAKEDGISDPLKASLKFDKHGLGHDVVKDIAFNWWDGVFNKALDTVGKSNQVRFFQVFLSNSNRNYCH